MATRVLLIEAAPTPWDSDGRIVGSNPLPLTAEGIDAIRHLLNTIDSPVTAVYCAKRNDACLEVARMVAKTFSLRVRYHEKLEEVGLGLWEGLTPEDVRFRFPTVYPQWEQEPLSVTPPDGEALADAINRIAEAMRHILKRNRELAIAFSLRPMALQIAAGLLRRETPELIAKHLQHRSAIETIEVDQLT